MLMFAISLILKIFNVIIFCYFQSKMTFESRRKSGKPPSTSEYLEALSIIRAYLEFLGCSEKELEALQVLESMADYVCQNLILSQLILKLWLHFR